MSGHRWHLLYRRCTDYNKEESDNMYKCARCFVSRYERGTEFTLADGTKDGGDPGCKQLKEET